MLPSFASLYYLMPSGSFYAPYAHLESSAAIDLTKIESVIEGALRRSLESRAIVINEWKLARIVVLNPRSKDGTALELNIMGTFEHANSGNKQPARSETQPAGVILPLLMPAGVGMLVGPHPDNTANISRPLFLDVSTHPTSFQNIETEFYNQLLETPFFPAGRAVVLTRQEDAEITRFFDGWQGNPIAVSKAFPRMMYFSAMVLTTVGFGDIVPMTPLARLCVAAQAIIGIMLAGLFLNAIAHRASHG